MQEMQQEEAELDLEVEAEAGEDVEPQVEKADLEVRVMLGHAEGEEEVAELQEEMEAQVEPVRHPVANSTPVWEEPD